MKTRSSSRSEQPTRPPESGDPLAAIFELLSEIRSSLDGRRKQLLTVDEVAELVGRAPYTIRRWIADGIIKSTRVHGTGPSGRLLIDRAELDRVIQVGRGGVIQALDSEPGRSRRA